MFDPGNVRFTPDNLSVGERQALATLKDVDNVAIKIQDKGTKFVVIDKSDYDTNMKQQIENPLQYQKLEHDPRADFVSASQNGAKSGLRRAKLMRKRLIGLSMARLLEPLKPTDKESSSLITSCCGTTIENLSAFTRFHLKPLAQQ